MSKLINIVKTHPKKTVFFTCAGGFITNFIYKRFKDNRLRRQYCDIMKQYGQQKIQPFEKMKNVMVLINPAAKESESFEKNIFPFLCLAGMKVDVAKGSRSAQVRDLARLLDPKSMDAILLVGGDGTAMEFLTGFMRNENFNNLKNIPIAFAPLGKVNNFVQRVIHPKTDSVSWCYKSIEPVIKDSIKHHDVMEIIPQDSNSEGELPKHIYFLSSLEWSVLREAEARRDKFWLTGPLRGYCACLWSAAKREWTSRRKSAKLIYSPPCQGCRKCREPPPPPPKQSWFMSLFGHSTKRPVVNQIDYSKIDNPECGVETELEVKDSSGIIVKPSNKGCLDVTIFSGYDNFGDYTSQCLVQINSTSCDKRDSLSAPQITNIQCASLQLIPDTVEGEEFFIDNENFEARPILIKLRRDAIKIFTSEINSNIGTEKAVSYL